MVLGIGCRLPTILIGIGGWKIFLLQSKNCTSDVDVAVTVSTVTILRAFVKGSASEKFMRPSTNKQNNSFVLAV